MCVCVRAEGAQKGEGAWGDGGDGGVCSEGRGGFCLLEVRCRRTRKSDGD